MALSEIHADGKSYNFPDLSLSSEMPRSQVRKIQQKKHPRLALDYI